jgi:very-long-chain enoyl-CoA reductase
LNENSISLNFFIFFAHVKVEIFNSKSLNLITTVEAQGSSTVFDVKNLIYKQKSKLYPDRQMLKFEATGKPLRDEEVLTNLKGKDSNSSSIKLYLKDLGPQVGWTTVIFLIYLLVFFVKHLVFKTVWFQGILD